jgi:flagellar FliL protein
MSEKKSDSAPAPEAAKTPAAANGGGIKAFMPALLAIIIAPAVTWGVAQFVLLPKLQTLSAGPAAAHEKPAEEPSGHGAPKGGHGAKAAPGVEGDSFKFENVVVNLAGTMGTRYLKVTFLVVGPRPNVNARFSAEIARLGDVTLATLSALTLSDLEETGSKNIIRERLVASYNQALGEQVVESLYFSEFVVQ